ncbi:hypothetical protein GLAREA_00872 [Glarea lozoyensis ATCC 20868]|uniref:Uncharacterized protein n=1 Tax=Glarea lozoyensis (strain ATCC 20868 / MF5171) TaxID=1116229 RepID=S3CTJ0_GLAL2|nr:uncharacterized protein GLAREA_00872 [Glarea lozoyensis ATCC 20868]EPE29712.1 hypothetical protein GLAREA_00872 [Glarea lozoyensis ATCC 20868]
MEIVSLETGRYSQSAGISTYSSPRYSYSKPPVFHRAPAVHRMLVHLSRADAFKQLLASYWLRAGRDVVGWRDPAGKGFAAPNHHRLNSWVRGTTNPRLWSGR